jgi:hypothetical protein
MGRTLLKNNTQKLVTHLLQNEKWLNDQIAIAQEAGEADRAADLINQHRLFVADLLPYCLPKLSATMNNDNDEAQKLIAELMSVGKTEEPSDIAINSNSTGNTLTPDGDK